MTGHLVVKHFYPTIVYMGPKPSIEDDAKYPNLTITHAAGWVSIQPVIVTGASRGSQTLKGAVVQVTDQMQTVSSKYLKAESTGGKTRKAVLDEDELKDLDAALVFFRSQSEAWAKRNPVEDVEAQFITKDQFNVVLTHPSKSEDMVVFQIGSDDSSSLDLTIRQVAELQTDVRQAIEQLAKN